MPSDIILIMLYEIPCKMSLGLNHHFLTTSQNVEQHLRSQSLISYSAFRLFRSTVVSSSFYIVANGYVQVSGTVCVRFHVRRTREIGREPADRIPPDVALKFAQCYSLFFS